MHLEQLRARFLIYHREQSLKAEITRMIWVYGALFATGLTLLGGFLALGIWQAITVPVIMLVISGYRLKPLVTIRRNARQRQRVLENGVLVRTIVMWAWDGLSVPGPVPGH